MGQRILDAAKTRIIRFGFDKTTINDIAREAGIAKSTLYLRWKTRDAIFGALLWRETRLYVEDWLARMEADPQGGTFSAIYKHALLALWDNPFLVALFTSDQRVLGRYMQRPEMQGFVQQRFGLSRLILTRLQAVGAIRRDVNLEAAIFVINSLQYGLLKIGEVIPPEHSPTMLDSAEVMVEMIDGYLSPAEPGDSEAGKVVIREMVQHIRVMLDELDQQQ